MIKLLHKRHLSLEGDIATFKSFAKSKIGHLALFITVSKNVIEELNEIPKKFLWPNKKYRIKYGTLCNGYNNGGLKNVGIALNPFP